MSRNDWKVFFHNKKYERPGKEIPVNKSFARGEQTWFVPSAYACRDGLVIDFCVSADNGAVKNFINKWQRRGNHYTLEEQNEFERENPLNTECRLFAIINGRESRIRQSSLEHYFPFSESSDYNSASPDFLNHYNLNTENCYAFLRAYFPWKTKLKPNIKSLKLRLEELPSALPAEKFTVSKAGEKISLTNPFTNKKHELFITEFIKEEIHTFDDESYEFPTKCTLTKFTLTPDLPNTEFYLQDTAPNSPVKNKIPNAAAVGIIGGADGPTAIILKSDKSEKGHTAISSLHFDAVDSVQFRAFFVKQDDTKYEVELI